MVDESPDESVSGDFCYVYIGFGGDSRGAFPQVGGIFAQVLKMVRKSMNAFRKL